jgi:hypothetical protein
MSRSEKWSGQALHGAKAGGNQHVRKGRVPFLLADSDGFSELKPQLLYSTDMVYTTCILFIQASFLFFYQRVFTLQKKGFKYAFFATAGLSISIWLSTLLTAIFKCRPIAFNWDRTIPGGTCINTKNFFIAALALNTANDFLIVFLPIPMIMKVQIRKSEKLALLVVFLFGLLYVFSLFDHLSLRQANDLPAFVSGT